MRCGIDVGGTKIETAILSDSGEFLSRERTNTPKNYACLLLGCTSNSNVT